MYVMRFVLLVLGYVTVVRLLAIRIERVRCLGFFFKLFYVFIIIVLSDIVYIKGLF